MKLHFHTYRKNVRHFESKEGFFNVCVLCQNTQFAVFYLYRVFDNQYVCFYFLNISVHMENEKAVLFFIILALLHNIHQIEDHFCEIMFLEQYKKGDNIKRQTNFFTSSYLPTSFPPFIFLSPFSSFSCHCLILP